ncbi:MAG: hypothetical protein H0W68_01530 [Gemmatimonadaceae bacterium]|nr:hypothetical protein [Gemmatimonadaceae bacterium]
MNARRFVGGRVWIAVGMFSVTAAQCPSTGARNDTTHALPVPSARTAEKAPRGTLEPTERAATGVTVPPLPVLTSVTLSDSSASGSARVTFQFDGGALPGYRVEYLPGPAIACGSGDSMMVRGAARLRVRFTPAAAHRDDGGSTIVERDRVGDRGGVVHLLQSCDFEGQVEWVLGVGARTPYRASELTSPARLVIDLDRLPR